jgi:tetratricopeptide (TPR) repeat protein
MSRGELEKAYEIFSVIIDSAPDWAEGWNKRATVLYLMGRYQESLEDIDEVLKHESRHFGALSGQGLVQTALENYEKAIKSYEAVQKIYPSIKSAEVMIPQLKKLIKDNAI